MKFRETPLRGAYLIEAERRGDDRGFFARVFCEREFADHGLLTRFVQMNNSHSAKIGTLRGLHYQFGPDAEAKVVRCVRGALYDVFLDLRPDSASFGRSFGVKIDAESRLQVYVPRGFAHGMLSLTDDTEVIYWASAAYVPESERGIRWNDTRFRIEWPIEPTEVSPKDAAWPDFDAEFHETEKLRGLV